MATPSSHAAPSSSAAVPAPLPEPDRLALLKALERKVLWLSSWMIHNANHIRPNRDGLKVGGHQASCSSVISIACCMMWKRISSLLWKWW